MSGHVAQTQRASIKGLRRSHRVSTPRTCKGCAIEHGRLACLLLLAYRNDVRRACLTLQGRSPLDMAFTFRELHLLRSE